MEASNKWSWWYFDGAPMQEGKYNLRVILKVYTLLTSGSYFHNPKPNV